jgi:hypothetical protein
MQIYGNLFPFPLSIKKSSPSPASTRGRGEIDCPFCSTHSSKIISYALTGALASTSIRHDTVVFNIMLANHDCNEKFGWDARMENNYYAFLMKVLPKQEFEHFVDEVDKALLKTKLKSGGNNLRKLLSHLGLLCPRGLYKGQGR